MSVTMLRKTVIVIKKGLNIFNNIQSHIRIKNQDVTVLCVYLIKTNKKHMHCFFRDITIGVVAASTL